MAEEEELTVGWGGFVGYECAGMVEGQVGLVDYLMGKVVENDGLVECIVRVIQVLDDGASHLLVDISC